MRSRLLYEAGGQRTFSIVLETTTKQSPVLRRLRSASGSARPNSPGLARSAAPSSVTSSGSGRTIAAIRSRSRSKWPRSWATSPSGKGESRRCTFTPCSGGRTGTRLRSSGMRELCCLARRTRRLADSRSWRSFFPGNGARRSLHSRFANCSRVDVPRGLSRIRRS